MIFGDGVFEDDEVVQADEPVVQSDEDKLRTLGKSLGLFSEEVESPDVVAEETTEVSETVPEVVEDKPESYSFKTEEDFSAAAIKVLEAKLGVPLDAVVEMLNDFGGYRNKQLIDEQKTPLKSEWGDEFDSRFAQVTEKYATLSPDMQKALDNTEGAKLIWAMIAQDGGTSVPTPPRFDRQGSTQNRAAAKFVYTQSQIDDMTSTEYRSNSAAINDAYQRGLVDTAN